jgi:hypothetical protein
MVYMLVALLVMLASVGGVGLVESRRFKHEPTDFSPDDTDDASLEEIQ